MNVLSRCLLAALTFLPLGAARLAASDRPLSTQPQAVSVAHRVFYQGPFHSHHQAEHAARHWHHHGYHTHIFYHHGHHHGWYIQIWRHHG
jgi:hypothetical protein